MKRISLVRLFLIAAIATLSVRSASAVTLYSDDFDSGTSAAAWTAVLSGADASADFAFDYGTTLGIPSAPNSTGGTTIGMSFLANQSAASQQGISATPNGESFAGDFMMTFDMWLNYNGPLGPTSVGGSGSTQVGSFGWGTDGTAAQWAGFTDGVMFGATGDGGSSFDYRLYLDNALVFDAANYEAGSLNQTDAYYQGLFGGEAAPAAQVGLFPGQTGTTQPGALGFAWREGKVVKIGSRITWLVDGNRIASADISNVALSGDNIFFGHFDINNSSSSDANDFLITSVFDNVVVREIPEPASALLLLFGSLGLAMRRR